jgi:hypothetical protein
MNTRTIGADPLTACAGCRAPVVRAQRLPITTLPPMTRAIRFVAAVLLTACASAAKTAPDAPSPTSTTTAAATADSTACEATPANSRESWKQVAAPGFTFCVPASWKRGGDTRWNGRGFVTWTRSSVREKVPFSVGRMTSRDMPAPSAGPQRMSETIGGQRAELSFLPNRGRFLTTADWESPVLRFRGEAPNEQSMQLHLDIFRTVRFTQP